MLRGGAFKPRTSPHTFQGSQEGLEILAEARQEETGLPIVTEVMDAHDIPLVGAVLGHAPDRCPEHAELRAV